MVHFGLRRKRIPEQKDLSLINDLESELKEATLFLENRQRLLGHIEAIDTEKFETFKSTQQLVILLKKVIDELEDSGGVIPDALMIEVQKALPQLERCIAILESDNAKLDEQIKSYKYQIKMLEETKQLNEGFKKKTANELKKIKEDIIKLTERKKAGF